MNMGEGADTSLFEIAGVICARMIMGPVRSPGASDSTAFIRQQEWHITTSLSSPPPDPGGWIYSKPVLVIKP